MILLFDSVKCFHQIDYDICTKCFFIVQSKVRDTISPVEGAKTWCDVQVIADSFSYIYNARTYKGKASGEGTKDNMTHHLLSITNCLHLLFPQLITVRRARQLQPVSMTTGASLILERRPPVNQTKHQHC